MTVSPYNGNFNGAPRDDDYVITVNHPDSLPRSFVGLRLGYIEDLVCYKVGNTQAGQHRESQVSDPNDSVIEGAYRDYIVGSLFATDYVYSHFSAVC